MNASKETLGTTWSSTSPGRRQVSDRPGRRGTGARDRRETRRGVEPARDLAGRALDDELGDALDEGLGEGVDGGGESPRARRIAVMCPDSSIDAACFGAALAVYLAQVGSARVAPRRPVVLVDGQPGTGGLDVILDLEASAGARWPALRGAGAHVDGPKLLDALPERDGVAVLSHSASRAVVDDVSRRATHEALADVSEAVVTCVAADPVPEPGEHDVLILLVRGTVASMAAAEHTVRAIAERGLDSGVDEAGVPDLPLALVALETPERARSVLADALGAPVVAAGPTRWRMGAECPKDLLAGRWPGRGDKTMTRLVRDVSMFVAGLDRELSWA